MNRDQAIIEFHLRHRGVPTDVIHDKFFPGLSQSATSQALSRLEQTQQLASQLVNGNSKLWRLGSAAVKRYGFRPRRANPLTAEQIRKEIGALDFFLQMQQHRLTPDELAKFYPRYPRQLLFQHPYYVADDGEKKILAQVRVELSKNPFAVMRKHQDSLARCCDEYKAFRRLYNNDEIMFLVISPFERLLVALSGHIVKAECYSRRYGLYHSKRLARYLGEDEANDHDLQL